MAATMAMAMVVDQVVVVVVMVRPILVLPPCWRIDELAA